jgi:ketosteroid isomerase-like protein
MSRENVEIVRRAFEAFDRADLEGMLGYIAPEFEFHTSGRFADTEAVYRGRQGWTDFWNIFRAAWEHITISIERIEDLDDRVLILGTFHGRGRESGVEITGDAAWLLTIRGGMVLHGRAFAGWDEGLEAAGLRE